MPYPWLSGDVLPADDLNTLIARVDSTTLNSADNSLELALFTLNSITFKAGRAYEIRVQCSHQTTNAANNRTRFRLRRNSLTGTIKCDFGGVNINGMGYKTECIAWRVRNNTGADITDHIVLSHQAELAIHSQVLATATDVAYMEVWRIGSASQFPNAVQI